MTINYYLDSKSLKGSEKSIMCFIRGIEKGKTIYLNTKIRINPESWNSEKQIVKKKHPIAFEINNFLSKLKNDINSLYYTLDSSHNQLNNKSFKKLINTKVLNSENNNHNTSIFDVFDEYMESKRPTITAGSYQKYKSMRTHLKNYEIYYKSSICFENMNLVFFDKFLNYGLKKAGHTNNTINKLIKQLKSFLYWSLDRGYHTNTEFKRVKTKEEKVDIVYLTNDELQILLEYDLDDRIRLKNIRDVFLLSCYTGARFSDISKLNIIEDIKNDTWYLRTQKTRDIIEIPLNDYAIEIIKPYIESGKKLPSITNQKSNEYLKELCKLIGLDSPTKVIKYRGTERIEIVKPKYELISTHTARRTFVTLSLEKGMRPEVVMEITGHKDYKTMRKYIKITSKVKHNEMKNVWKKVY